MATVSEFLSSYPEFEAAQTESPGLLEAKLAEAARRVNASIMGDVAEDAVKMKAAILLMRSPWARSLRLEKADTLKTWEDELRQMQEAKTAGLRMFV